MNHPALRAISVFILLLVSSITQADHLTIRNAWIPEAPPVTSVMAGFMEIENISTTAAEITAISSKDFGRIEMHLSREENGIARMLPQKKLVIPARGTLKLEHGSYHLMLFKPLRRLKDGDSTELLITLASGDSFSITVMVEKSAMMMDHSNH